MTTNSNVVYLEFPNRRGIERRYRGCPAQVEQRKDGFYVDDLKLSGATARHVEKHIKHIEQTTRVVHVTFLDRPEIPEAYRNKSRPVRVEGNSFYIGDDVLTGAPRAYAMKRILEIDEAATHREKKREQPIKDLVATEGGPGSWGLPVPVEAF